MKNRRKLLSILLTLSLMVAMLVPMATPAFAAAGVSAASVPNVTTTGNANIQLGQIKIDSLSVANATYGDQVQILLPSGVKFANLGVLSVARGAADVYGNQDYLLETAGGTVVAKAPGTTPNTNLANSVSISGGTVSSQLLTLSVMGNSNAGAGALRINPFYDITSASSGPVNVTLQDTGAAITAGKLQIANVVSGGTTATVSSTASMAQNGSDHATFIINENTATALGASGYFYVDLPSHFTWSFNTAAGSSDGVTLAGGFTTPYGITATNPTGLAEIASANAVTGGPIGVSITQNSSGNSRMLFNVNTRSSNLAGTIQVTATITADNSAPTGDITATFGGTDPAFTATTATIGTGGNYNVTATAGTQPTVFAGQAGQTVGTFTLAEQVANTLINTRNISISLPGGVRWSVGNYPVATIQSGSISALTNVQLSGDHTTVTYTVANTGTSASTIQFSQGQVDVDAGTAAGTLVATISGSGINQTVDIAKLSSPVTATASTTPDVQLGQASQAAGDFTVVENAAGAIKAQTSAGGTTQPDYLTIIAPSGVTFSGVPTIKVTSGDLTLNPSGATLTGYNGAIDNEIQIPVNNGSTTASTISFSGLNLNIDNTVPTGPIKLALGGSSLITPTISYTQTVAGVLVNQSAPNPPINGTYVNQVPVANCASAISKTTGGTAKFTIGSTTFTMNGTDQTMDAAPYLKNDRTYLPIRFVAQAVGVADSNIIWNSDDQSVTLIKGGSVVKLVIGSTTMTINGTPITMDTAPEIVDPGRTMLPVSWVAKALGANITWDAATQTVTVN